MKIGVLQFSYAHAVKSMRKVEEDGFYSINLGDSAQSLAVRCLLGMIGIVEADIANVDRDSLPFYAGDAVALIMNGVFYDRNFPLPNAIHPIFVGFCTKSVGLVERYRDWFKRFEPIGCRDVATAELMRTQGIEAIVTGCLTMTLPPRQAPPAKGRLFVVHGSGAGQLPSECLKHVPDALLDSAEFIHNRLPANEIPLSAASCAWIERYQAHLLDRYRTEASLVLTPLLHVASPCLAMGVPVILCRKNRDTRFGYIKTLLPLHTPGDVAAIDWAPKPIDVNRAAARLTAMVMQSLDSIRA